MTLKKSSLTTLTLLCSLFTAGAVHAIAQESYIEQFSDLSQKVMSLGDPQHTLVVLDNDETLTRMPCDQPDNPKQCSPNTGTWTGLEKASGDAGHKLPAR